MTMNTEVYGEKLKTHQDNVHCKSKLTDLYQEMETFREGDELFKQDQETKDNKSCKIWKFLNYKDRRNMWRFGMLMFIITTVVCLMLIMYYCISSSNQIAKSQENSILQRKTEGTTTNEDACVSSPCFHGGTCITAGCSYYCKCPEGYSGYQYDETPCSLEPCLHNGNCTVFGSSFICSCMEGHMGSKCEEEISCTDGWTLHKDNCYYFSSRKLNWNDAQRACKTRHSMLVEATSESLIGFLKTNAKKYLKERDTAFWLGGSDLENEGVWVWTTSGRNFSETDWHTRTIREPNNRNGNGNEHCLELNNILGYEWNDDNCLKRNKYIC